MALVKINKVGGENRQIGFCWFGNGGRRDVVDKGNMLTWYDGGRPHQALRRQLPQGEAFFLGGRCAIRGTTGGGGDMRRADMGRGL